MKCRVCLTHARGRNGPHPGRGAPNSIKHARTPALFAAHMQQYQHTNNAAALRTTCYLAGGEQAPLTGLRLCQHLPRSNALLFQNNNNTDNRNARSFTSNFFSSRNGDSGFCRSILSKFIWMWLDLRSISLLYYPCRHAVVLRAASLSCITEIWDSNPGKGNYGYGIINKTNYRTPAAALARFISSKCRKRKVLLYSEMRKEPLISWAITINKSSN